MKRTFLFIDVGDYFGCETSITEVKAESLLDAFDKLDMASFEDDDERPATDEDVIEYFNDGNESGGGPTELIAEKIDGKWEILTHPIEG